MHSDIMSNSLGNHAKLACSSGRYLSERRLVTTACRCLLAARQASAAQHCGDGCTWSSLQSQTAHIRGAFEALPLALWWG